MKNFVFIVSAPSGTGKSTVLRSFLENNFDFKKVLSTTTRMPRYGEIDGKDYRFYSDQDFAFALAAQEFVESNTLFGNNYGVLKKDFWLDQNLVLEVDFQGAAKIKEVLANDASKEVVTIFMLPPSMEILEQRLRGRSSESSDDISERLARAREELKNYRDYDYTIVVSDVATAVNALNCIYIAEQNKTKNYANFS